jgi:hypothetical protein
VTEFRAPKDERLVFDIARSFKAWKNAVFMERFDTLSDGRVFLRKCFIWGDAKLFTPEYEHAEKTVAC